MADEKPLANSGAYQFFLEKIDSVPQLEALVLLWESRPSSWTAAELAARLYIPPENAAETLRGLVQLGLIHESSAPPLVYSYNSRSTTQDALMSDVHTTYRRELVRVSHMIHSKASSAVREFARAFRFRKEPDK